MRILLLGEFSSLHKFLKDGLKEIGYSDVLFVSNGDGWKKIAGMDIRFPELKSAFGIFQYYHQYIQLITSFMNYDVVQFMNAGLFPFCLAKYFVKSLRTYNRCLSLLCAGSDYEQLKVYRRHVFKYCIYDYDKSLLKKYDKKTIRGRIRISNEKYLAEQMDILIPSLYTYSLGYQERNMYDIIPFPINLNKLEYQANNPKYKVVFFHGINNEFKKGTPFIREALNRLAERYPSDVEVIINKRMPYDEYVQVMRKANVIVDQCCGNGYGINACLSMAQGKITMAGNDPAQRPSINSKFCPIVHIEPDVDQIYSQLEFLLENRKNFEQWGYESRRYVETYHECKMIAQKYIDAWKSTGKL